MSSPTDCSRICTLLVLFVSLVVAFRDPNNYMLETHKVVTRSSNRHYCGNNLVRALHFLCESYNKRSSLPFHSQTQDSDDVVSDDEDAEESKNPFALIKVHNNNDNNNIKYFHRMVRGVVDECCRRSCTTSQLSQYCGVTRVTTTTAAPLVID